MHPAVHRLSHFKLFKFVHHTLVRLFSAANCSFEPTCHSAGRSTSMRFQTSLWCYTCCMSLFCFLLRHTNWAQSRLPDSALLRATWLCVIWVLQMADLAVFSLRTSSPDDKVTTRTIRASPIYFLHSEHTVAEQYYSELHLILSLSELLNIRVH